jgi:putative peptide zinc metalloprotease protein
MSDANGNVEALWPDDDDVVPLGPRQAALELDQATPARDELGVEWALPAAAPPPAKGWRRVLHILLAGTVELPPGGKELRRRELVEQVRTRIAGCHTIAFVSRKGGVGKTTTCLLAGHTLASLRGDRVVALDATPDSGTLAHRLRPESTETVATLARDRELIGSYSDIREYTSQAPSRLDVVAGTDALDGAELRAALELLERHFTLICLDTAAGTPRAATTAAVELADQIVIVSTGGLDAARAAASTLDWLEDNGHESVAASAVTILNNIRDGRRRHADIARIEAHFASRCRTCIRIPCDPWLETGTDTSLERLRPATREAALELAAAIAHGFSTPTERRPSP